MSDLEKRTDVYCERPYKFEMSGCPDCGNDDCDWSEFKHHLWCQKCNKDFIPASSGIFDGPVCVAACELIGIYFDTIDIATGEIKPGPSGVIHFSTTPPEEAKKKP